VKVNLRVGVISGEVREERSTSDNVGVWTTE